MWTKAFWRATAERIIRGALVSVAAAYFGGDLVFDALNVNSWRDVGSLAITGAFASLLLSLGGNALTKSGPSFTDNEVLSPPAPKPPPEAGAVDVVLAILVVVLVVVVLLLFRVHL